MNELDIIEALKASRAQKLQCIDESEAALIEAVRVSHDVMREGVNSQSGGSAMESDLSTRVGETDAAEREFPPVKATVPAAE